MDSAKQKALEAAGWRFGDAADFLELTQEERQLLDIRVEVALAVRRQRQALHLSQQDLANRINTSQPRIAKIERAARDVSLDQILRAFAAVGGRVHVTQRGSPRPTKAVRNPAPGKRKKSKADMKAQVADIQIELIGTEL